MSTRQRAASRIARICGAPGAAQRNQNGVCLNVDGGWLAE